MKYSGNFFNTIVTVFFLLALHTASYAAPAKPRIGFETETALHNQEGQELRAPSDVEREERSKEILKYLQSIFGGAIETSDGELLLSLGDDKPGAFKVDYDWASDLTTADGYELVTPPLNENESETFVSHYDEIGQKLNLKGGVKTSQQFNVEVRNLIPGFSLEERPSSKMGIPYKDILDANVSKVVDLFLFLEDNAHFIYAAFAPKRLGYLVNYFSVPFSFEHEQLLKELRLMPPEARTYSRVREVFMRYESEEKKFAAYGDGINGSRTPWKYRTYNLRKLFAFNEAQPTWIYPVIEIRPPDTPSDTSHFRRQLALVYALYYVGSNSPTGPSVTPPSIDRNSKYREFLRKYRDKLPFTNAFRIINQDMVARSFTLSFQNDYAKFLSSLKLKAKDYVAFAGAEPSPFVSQTFDVYRLFSIKHRVRYLDREIELPLLNLPWDLKGFSFGAEFEFRSKDPRILEKVKTLPFLEPEITREVTTNLEVITKPTTDLMDLICQILYMRDVLGDELRSIHLNFRFPKTIYERIPKQKFDAWIARIGDWISVVRANYTNPLYSFQTRTQNRMQVDTPNSWIADNKVEYRGTMRIYHVGDRVNVEIRGLMDGVYSKVPMESDLHLVSLFTILKGLHQPELIEGNYALRLMTEAPDPARSLEAVMASVAASKGVTLESLPHKVSDLVSALKAPQLMQWPLVGFEYMPYVSAHDAKQLERATLNWKAEVWRILSDKSLNDEDRKTKFVESLKAWSRTSGLEQSLFDSLLVRPFATSGWSDLNLPPSHLRVRFLQKLLRLQKSEHAKVGLELFMVSWFQRDRRSFIRTAQGITTDEARYALEVLRPHESIQRIQTLAKELRLDKIDSNLGEATLYTNLESLMAKHSDLPSFESIFRISDPKIRLTLLKLWKENEFPVPSPQAFQIGLRRISEWFVQKYVSIDLASPSTNEWDSLLQLIELADLSTEQKFDVLRPAVKGLLQHYQKTRDGKDNEGRKKYLTKIAPQLTYDLIKADTVVVEDLRDFGIPYQGRPIETIKEIFAVNDVSKRLEYFKTWFAKQKDFTGAVNLESSVKGVAGNDPRIQDLLQFRTKFTDAEQQMLNGPVTAMMIYLIRDTNFNQSADKKTEVKSTVLAMKVLAPHAIKKNMTILVELYAKGNNSFCSLANKSCLDALAQMVDYGGFSPSERLQIIAPAVEKYLDHARSKSGSDRLDHLRKLVPYLTMAVLKNDSRTIEELRDGGVSRIGPSDHVENLPPRPSLRSTGGGSFCNNGEMFRSQPQQPPYCHNCGRRHW